MSQIFLAAILVVGLFTGEGASQTCYSQSDCAGNVVEAPGPTVKDCCVGTNDGQSFANSSGTCIEDQCVVHGFASLSYDVVEEERLDTTFGLNVKGSTNFPSLVLLGTVTSQAGTASSNDFEMILPIVVDEASVEVRLFTTNDEVTLEYNDTVMLKFTAINAEFIPGVEGVGEFIRDTATVNIIDNDRLEINIEEADYSIQEGDTTDPMIRLQLRRTQSPFIMTLHPVSILDLDQHTGAGQFITPPDQAGAIATPDKDFTSEAFNVTVPATEDEDPGAIFYKIPYNFRVIDDKVNEIEQSFALVAELVDVPDDIACFQRQVGDTECFGKTGATQIKILDDDPMIVGFSQRRQTVSEAREEADSFNLNIDVHSLNISEIVYQVQFRVLDTGTAIVAPLIVIDQTGLFDAQFGSRNESGDPLVDSRDLESGSTELSIMTTIINDFVPENPLKCYTIRILSPDLELRDIFACFEDLDASTDFFCLHTICIVDDDEPFEVAYIQTTYTVIESEGQVEVCVNLTEPQFDILDETVQVEAINNESSIYIPPNAVLATPDSPNFLGMYPMAEGTDYEEQIRGINRIRNIVINATRRIICYNQIIYDDVRLEVSEYAGLTLVVRDFPVSSVLTFVKPMYDQIAIKILDDDDGAVVGLERTFYQVSENVGVVEVCAIVYRPTVVCPIEFPFNVALNTTDGSAVSPMDYVSVNTILEFDTCDTRQCTEISIVDDMIVELTESFFVTLERTPGLDTRITLDPVDGEIEITDDDEAVVGLERTSYTVSENVSVVEVCTIVYSPSLPCPIDHPFNVRFSTYDRTAVTPMDYGAVTTILRFAACDTRRCVDVSIINDGDDEPDEMFGITLERTPGLNDRITLDPVDGVVIIIDDDMPAEPGILVNDTLTGDPLMTVPIHTDPDVMEGDVITSLCYEVHGEAGKFFNLVSDSCVSVNSHYSRALTNPNIDLNIVDAIGVRAVSNNGTCVNIRVGLDCEVTVNDAAISRIHRFNGITIRVYPNRVRISVPNCEDTDLVMWVFCTSGRTEDPTDWMYFDFDFIRFVVMRGLNLNEESHGLIGQFWNVPVDVTENTGSFNGAFRDDDYIITVNYPGSPPRSFVGLRYSVTWEFEKRPCLYVGNSQAGPLGETVDPNDSVIEGTYQNYEVDSLFSPEFDFSHFDETQCV